MKIEEQRLVDQGLASNEPCIGAAFCTYTFDPAFFEESVLRAVLQLESDPVEDAARYHEEARAALKRIPVACVIDGSVLRGGRRLPYDVHVVRGRTYHPKVYLVLYESEARLAVGSGNLTRSGIEQNTELFFVRRLRYDHRPDAVILRAVSTFLSQSKKLARAEGAQLDLVRKTITNRVGSTVDDREAPAEARFVTTFGESLIEQISRALPDKATITRIGVLAPFYEHDDHHAADSVEGVDSILATLATLRPTDNLAVDVAVPWDDAAVIAPDQPESAALDEGRLWAWRRKQADGVERVDYVTIHEAKTQRVRAVDAHGRGIYLDRAEVEAAILDHSLWPLSRPQVFAPAKILGAIARTFTLQLWLHPTTQRALTIQRRPLHAKLVTITARERGKTHTLVLMGSANASKSALGRPVEQRGNVEAGVLLRLDGEARLHELLPSLVAHTLDGVLLVERPAIEHGVDLSAWIRDAVHDATQRTLTITWSEHGPAALGDWQLRYCDTTRLHGSGAALTPTTLEDFDLDAASAELTFRADGREWPVPIRVLDLSALPDNPALATLGLRELLAVLGRRVGAERISTIHNTRGVAGVNDVLDAVFGEGFGPTDVFKAWWGIADELSNAATVSAFRARLHGHLGAQRVWEQLRDCSDRELSQDEVWLYGCELLRELTLVTIAQGPDHADKRSLLDAFVHSLRTELRSRAPDRTRHAWVEDVAKFYGTGAIDAAP